MIAIIGGIVVGLIVLVASFNMFFPNDGDFKEVIYYYFKPDLVSMVQGEYGRDRAAEFKLGLWILLGAVMGFAAFAGLEKIFGS